MTPLFRAILLLVFATTTLAQGVQLSNPAVNPDLEVRFPSTVSQCDPIRIFYNSSTPDNYGVVFFTPDFSTILKITVPIGVGYLEWICDIPAGHGFWVVYYFIYYTTVQSGSSSGCLSPITTTYAHASYNTTVFQSYTALSPTITFTIPLANSATSTVPFPTGTFSTVTINPDLDARTTSTSTASLSASTSSHKSNAPAIAGGIVGGIVVLAVALGGALLFLRRRRKSLVQEWAETPLSAEHPSWVSGQAPVITPQSVLGTASDGSDADRAALHSSSPINGDTSEQRRTSSALPSAPSIIRKDNPVILQYPESTPQTRESTSPQPNTTTAASAVLNLPPDVGQQEHSSGVPVPDRQLESASGSVPGGDANILEALNTFSRLTPDQRRVLVPVLSTMASPSPVTREDDPPPSYHD